MAPPSEDPPGLVDHMLTTVDNPFNPFTHFNEWYGWDVAAGYNTLQYLARIAMTTHDLPDALYSLEVERAIDEIIEMNVLGIYMKVKESDTITPVVVAIEA